MNRADQAHEPSIEELLASIRLIISDADKQAPFQKEPVELGVPAADFPPVYVPGEVTADEVFDLTDELVFPDAAARHHPAPLRAGTPVQPGLDGYPGLQAHLAPRRGAAALPAPDGAPASASARAAQERLDAAQSLRPESRNAAQPPVSRPIWSRRELPAAAAQFPAAPRPRQEPVSARPPARSWAGDIQMPVPDEGPASMFPSPQEKGRLEKPSADGGGAVHKQAGVETRPQAARGDGDGETAVAVLAQRLARSAMGVLEASELESVKQVDFGHLDAVSKADVTEKFADAIEIAALVAGEESSPPEMDDGQGSQPAPQEQPAAKSAATVAPAPAREAHRDAEGEAEATAEAPMQAEVEAHPPAKEELTEEASAEPAHVPDPVPVEPVQLETPAKMAPVKPSTAPAPLAVQPLAQAQFMGPAQPPVSAQAGGSLETAVREMLRPLLVQWLNENMPRILENAIREEIAVRGLLPRSNS